MPVTTLLIAIVLAVVALMLLRRGVAAPPIAPAPRLLDGLHGSPGTLGDYSVVLVAVGPYKIRVIKALRELSGAGLTEAKSFADRPGSAIARVTHDVGERIVAALQNAGATAQLRGPDA
ncbi:MAG TPA: ribosomal protein L7/L12 [Candidatus Baltobacteraceae bacterium]